jgi:hypothetical protein
MQTIFRISPAVSALLLFVSLSVTRAWAQASYTGPSNETTIFKVGDLVEATYAGSWYPAEVVGAFDPEAKTYQIHFDGEKYCSNHRLDSRLNAQFVRSRKKSEAPATASKANPVPAASNEKTGVPTSTPTAKAPASGSATGTLGAGTNVKYAGAGVLWQSGAKIERYDAAKRQYTVRDKSGSGDIVPCYAVYKEGDPINNSFFAGDWEVRVNGATTTFVKGNDLYRRFSGGLKLPPLQIKADGTYTWINSENQIIKGRWVPRPEGVPGIVILKGLDGMDWTVYEKTEGYSPTSSTRDEIGFHHLPSHTGYYSAYRIGPNRSCVLAGRTLKP